MTKGINELQPKRLEQALAARQLSKAQLASLVGVTASTVTKWCQGTQKPEAETFDRIASVLNFQPHWFTRADLPAVSPPLYRSNASALKTARAKLEAHAALTQECAYLFSEHIDFPQVNLPIRDFRDPEEISDSDIEFAAEECRRLWQLGSGPIQDLMLAAEGAGIIVVREETEITAIEGLSAWSDVLFRPIILLSSDKANGFRSRFDLAHEIGHLILHKNIPRAEERDRHNQMEKQAHRFAGALLLHAQTFASEVRIPPTLDNLLILKQRWGASVAAMTMRLHALGMLRDDEKLNLFKRRSARWGTKAEPFDDKWVPEKPRLLKRTIELLAEAGVMPLEAIPRYLGPSARDIEKFCGLRENYFEKPAEILELATLRSRASEKDKNTANGIPFDATRKVTSLSEYRR